LTEVGSLRSRGANRSLIATRPRIEIPVSGGKHRHMTISNRNKNPPFLAVFSKINRHTELVEQPVSHWKQRTAAEINRHILGFASPRFGARRNSQPIGSTINSLQSLAEFARIACFQPKAFTGQWTWPDCNAISEPRAMLSGGKS
jgi:hypothetical protein